MNFPLQAARLELSYHLSLAHLEPTKPLTNRELYKAYRREVIKVVDSQDIAKLDNYQKRGFKGYHLNYKQSIRDGFNNGISPEVIGNIDNLEFIHYKDK